MKIIAYHGNREKEAILCKLNSALKELSLSKNNKKSREE
jgi:hypothetical protein